MNQESRIRPPFLVFNNKRYLYNKYIVPTTILTPYFNIQIDKRKCFNFRNEVKKIIHLYTFRNTVSLITK